MSRSTLLSRRDIIDRFVLTPEEMPFVDRIRAVQIRGARHGKAGMYPDGDYSSDADWCYGVGAEINAIETALGIDDSMVFDLYAAAHETFFRDGTINPGDRPGQYGRETCFTFRFGAYNDTTVSVWARSCDDALELAAEWLAEHAPGHIMPEGDDHLEDLRREVCEEFGLVYPPECDHSELEERGYYVAFEQAEADLTYTESGYLTSYEWTFSEDDNAPGHDPSHAGPRHYGPARNADGTRK
jgi:hypothetical protein